MKILIALLFCGAGLFLFYLWMQARSLQQFDREMLPLLAKLARNPDLQPEHQRFLQALRKRDQRLQQIKSKIPNLGFTYAPSTVVRDRLVAHLALHPADKQGHERFVATFQKVEYLSDAHLLESLLQQYVDHQNALAQERIELCLGKAIALSPSLMPTLRTYLFETPITFGSARSFYSGVTKLFRLPMDQRQRLYNMTLELLRQNPRSVAARQLVLDVGRWHFGKSHENGSPTMFDDERVRHDIQVATASGQVAEPALSL